MAEAEKTNNSCHSGMKIIGGPVSSTIYPNMICEDHFKRHCNGAKVLFSLVTGHRF